MPYTLHHSLYNYTDAPMRQFPLAAAGNVRKQNFCWEEKKKVIFFSFKKDVTMYAFMHTTHKYKCCKSLLCKNQITPLVRTGTSFKTYFFSTVKHLVAWKWSFVKIQIKLRAETVGKKKGYLTVYDQQSHEQLVIIKLLVSFY